MGSMLRRLAVFAVIACAASYVILFILGAISRFDVWNGPTPIVVRDTYEGGAHTFAGALAVPYTCDDVLVRVVQDSTTTYALTFNTWQDSAIRCLPTDATRPFEATVFAPSTGVTFDATMDGTAIPIVIVEQDVQPK